MEALLAILSNCRLYNSIYAPLVATATAIKQTFHFSETLLKLMPERVCLQGCRKYGEGHSTQNMHHIGNVPEISKFPIGNFRKKDLYIGLVFTKIRSIISCIFSRVKTTLQEG